MGVGQMFEILLLILVLVKTQIQVEKLDSTGELWLFSDGKISNILKSRIPIYSPEEYDKFMNEFKEEEIKERIQNFEKLENKQNNRRKKILFSKII